MCPVKDSSHPAAMLWLPLAGLGLLAALKGVVSAWGGGELLLAQASFTAGEMLVLLTVLPPFRGREALRVREAGRRSGPGLARRGFALASALLLLGLGAGLLRQGMLLLNGSGPAEPTGRVIAAILILGALELILWLYLSSWGRRWRSLGAAVIAGSYRADLLLLGGTAATAAAAWHGWPVPAGLAVAGLGILVLLQAQEAFRRGLCPADQQAAERLLRPFRERVSGITGVVAIHKITAQPAGNEEDLNLHLELVVDDGTAPARLEQVREAARRRLAENFTEVSRVSVQAVFISSIRESIRRRARYL